MFHVVMTTTLHTLTAVLSVFYIRQPTDDKTILLADGSRYNTDFLQTDPLLASIHLWDYPIFDLERQAENLMLSQVRRRQS